VIPPSQGKTVPALAHGAVDLALAGHLSPAGKGRATPAELADDLLGYLRAAARSR